MILKQSFSLFLSLLFSLNASALVLNFNDADSGSNSFSLLSEGITYTFTDPSADAEFTISSNQLLFGTPNGNSATPNLSQFTLTVTGGDGVLSGYSTGNQTSGADEFSITGPNTNNNYNGLLGTTASLSSFITPLTLIENQAYIFSYDFTANNPASSGITGLSGIDVAPSAVPIPAAIWLFGSALVGLLGLKRKTS